MLHNRMTQFLLVVAISSLSLALAACGEDSHDDPDHAHLDWITAPETTQTAGTSMDVTWMVHTEGDLHHTEIRACMGQTAECGLDGQDSFDMNFQATMDGDNYNATVTLDTVGTWSVAVYAHVGETPHISEVIYVTVE